MSTKRPSLIPAMLMMKCPNCRKGDMFVNKHIFPLATCVRMNQHCPNCGQQLVFETNNGPGINYALTMIIYMLNIVWYWPIFGISYKDNSVFYFLITTTVVVIVLQPWLMRISRVIYLYAYLASKSA
jgi:uncharacterized protein (DUF983 family)